MKGGSQRASLYVMFGAVRVPSKSERQSRHHFRREACPESDSGTESAYRRKKARRKQAERSNRSSRLILSRLAQNITVKIFLAQNITVKNSLKLLLTSDAGSRICAD